MHVRLTAALLGLLVLRPPAAAQQVDPPAAVKLQEDDIAEEVELLTATHWAGTYCDDNEYFRLCLRLAPHAGFLLTRIGCLGSFRYALGAVREQEGELQLVVREGGGPPDAAFDVYLERIRILRWGDRQFVLPVANVGTFCAYARNGLSPPLGEAKWLLRVADVEASSHSEQVPDVCLSGSNE